MAENSDAVRRRELRIKKILENSDCRMQKLMGFDKSSTKDGHNHSKTTLSDTTLVTSRVEKGHRPTNTVHLHKDTTSSVSLPTVQTNSIIAEIATKLLKEDPVRTLKPLLNFSENAASTPHEPEKTSRSSWGECVRMSIVISLACFVRLSLYLDLAAVFLKSIIIPFILLETGFFTYKVSVDKAVAMSNVSSLLSGALFLCGVSNAVISNTMTALHYATIFCNDFSLYLFTFFICHWLCEYVL